MNELKRELMKVAGDLSESETRVKEAVERRVQKRKRKWLPVTVIASAVAVLLLFTQYQNNDTSAMLSHEEYAYYLHYESAMWDGDLDNYDKTRAFVKLLERAGRVEYGKSLGLSVSQADIDTRIEENKRFMDLSEYQEMMDKVLNEANISKKTYEEIILHRQIESSLMGDLIAQQLKQQYKQLNDVMARHMMNHYAATYMEEHYVEEVEAFREQYQIEQQYNSPTSVMGVIGLVEGNMFYLIQDAIWSDVKDMTRQEIIATYFANEKGAWYPNVDGLKVNVGDIIRVLSGASGSEDGHRVGMNHGGAEILQATTSPNLTIRLIGQQEQQFTEYIETLGLETNIHVSMVRLPDYTVTANGVTYSIWAKYNNSGMEIVRHHPNGYVKLTKSQAAPLYELLQ